MRNLVETFLILATGLLFLGSSPVQAQTSNRVWFAVYNGSPTPSSDVGIEGLFTDGSANLSATGSATALVAQTNFTSFSSPYEVVVDPAMGKAYVLDNNVQGTTPEYIYSFNLSGTPAQIAASAQIIFTMPVPAADVGSGVYPLISGLALDAVGHYLYFNQTDFTTPTNSYLGRLDLATSSKSDLYASAGANPLLHISYAGQVPGLGPISLDHTNVYLGAINARSGNSGVYFAPSDGSGVFSELVALSTNDVYFTNGFVSGVLSDSVDHFVYYLTRNAGAVNSQFNPAQNALWVYDSVHRTNLLVASAYLGYPGEIAADPANGRYYFTIGTDGTSALPMTNYQAIFTGKLGFQSAPTRLYAPVLSGQDASGGLNAGSVALQGIFIEDSPTIASLSPAIYLAGGLAVGLSPGLVVSDPSSTALAGAVISVSSGVFPNDGDVLTAVTNGTAINYSYNVAKETLTLSGNDTLANYQQVLRSVTFRSTNNDPTASQAFPLRTVTWSVNDGGLTSMVATSTVTLVTVPVPGNNHLTIVPVNGGWILVFTGNPNQSYVIQSAPSVTGPWTQLSPVLTTDAAGFLAYQDPAMAQVHARFYRVYHAPPTLSNLSSSIYLAGGAPIILSPGLLASDPASTVFVGATVSVSGGIFAGDGDVLGAVTNGTAIVARYNAGAETLTLTGSDTLANYQQVLRTVSFNSTNLDPTLGHAFPARTVSWSLSDGVASSGPVSSQITILTVGAPAIKHSKIIPVSGGWILLFTGNPGQPYVIQTAAALGGPWTDLSSALTANPAGLIAFQDSLMPLATTRYYRVRLGP